MADGSETLLMAPDLQTALRDVAGAGDAWRADKITMGRDVVMEGEALAAAVRGL
jgi:hypothetical protein